MVTPEPVLPMSFLQSSAASGDLLTQEGGADRNFAGLYVGAVLREMSTKVGHVKVAELWRQSGIRWQSLLAANRDVEQFLSKNVRAKLYCTVHYYSEPDQTPISKKCPLCEQFVRKK